MPNPDRPYWTSTRIFVLAFAALEAVGLAWVLLRG
jgi:hypothetical protein